VETNLKRGTCGVLNSENKKKDYSGLSIARQQQLQDFPRKAAGKKKKTKTSFHLQHKRAQKKKNNKKTG